MNSITLSFRKLLVAVVAMVLVGAVVLIGVPASHVTGILQVDVENITTYLGDTPDYSKLASIPSLTAAAPKAFAPLGELETS